MAKELWKMLAVYKGISKILQTESIMKCTFTFILLIVVPCKNIHFWLSNCWSSAGTDFLELCGAVSMIPGFQGHLEMTTSQLSFHLLKQQEIPKDHMRQVERVGYHNHVCSNQKLLHWQSSVSWHTVLVTQPVLVLPPIKMFFWWTCSLIGCKTSSQYWSVFINSFAEFLNTLSLWPVEERPKCLQSPSKVSLCLNDKSVFYVWNLSPKAILSISWISNAVFTEFETNFMQMCCSFQSYNWETIQRVMGAERLIK